MSSEEEELASLRERRAEKLGIPLAAPKNRREAQSPPSTSSSSESEEEQERPQFEGTAEDQPAVVDAAELYADEGRSQFPIEFGETLSQPDVPFASRFTLCKGTERLRKEMTQSGFVSPNDTFTAAAWLEHDPYQLPITHEALLQGHSKLMTSIDVDHSGSRVISGSFDNTVRLYDFNGMKSDMRSFRCIEPHEGHPVFSLSFSPSGDRFLVVTGGATPKVYDRDGMGRGTLPRGDMYIRDMKNTKGHVCGCCQGQWHPDDKGTALTCSEDGTLRIWDMYQLVQKTVIKPNQRKAGRVAVTSCAYNSDGSLIVGGLRDGSIQIWGAKGERVGRSAAIELVQPPKLQMIPQQEWTYLSNAALINRASHAAEQDITSLCFAKKSQTLLSRCMDGTMKIWDLRRFKQPLAIYEDLPNCNEQTQCCFSPDERLVLTGVSAEVDRSFSGGIVFIDWQKAEIVHKVELHEAVCPILWHDKLNQIFYGTGSRNNGRAHVLYHPDRSERGALLCAGKIPRKKLMDEFESPVVVHAPNALPMYQQPRNRKRLLQKEYEEKLKKMRPEADAATVKELGVGKGGKLGATGGTLLTQYLMRTRGNMKSVEEEADPREELLRHHHAKEEFGIYTAAYRRTQPTPIFAQVEEEEKAAQDDDEEDS